MSKHTPGPWHVEWAPNGKSKTVRANRSLLIADVPANAVCWEANARLIAAAPELLDALRFAIEQLEAGYEVTGGSHGGGVGLEAIRVVRAAIAKAEGK